MIWLTWRLQRLETALVLAALALAAASLIPLGLHMASVYSASGVGACLAHGGSGCGSTVDSFQHRFEHAGAIIPWLNFLPGLIGVLFAAPLILDFEHGTFRFAWTQSVPRNRWLTVRLTVMCAAALLATFALIQLMTWFRIPLDHVSGRMEPNVFDFEGIVPYAYTLFALALVLAIGIVTRRAVTAAAVGLIAYFALRVGIQIWLRKDFIAPLRKVWPVGLPGPSNVDRAWSITSGPSDASGHLLPPTTANHILALCNNGSTKQGDLACMRAHHVFNLAVYQPASRFWLLQGIETAIFAALAAALLATAVWWVRNRVS
ncbi:MAG: hypothetical protein E6G03_15130 [Actinobacteria bacterium]|nr:MAG: hypothetical protein E6G03_15130 [Actinomycetota bacterium]